MVHELVAQASGEVSVDRQEGVTAVTVTLPQRHKEPQL
jgi:hypothetical protein